MKYSLSKAVGGAFLVGGTAIGAGMLALPVVTGTGGLLPAIVIFFLCWVFSACTGLLFLEICLWMPSDANIITMAHHLLGPIGKVCAWILYIFLFYCLTIAYTAGGGNFIVALFQGNIPHIVGLILFSLVFGSCVYLGTFVVDRMNFILMIGLIISYFVFIFLGVDRIQSSFLTRMNWIPSLFALPVIFTSFSYQGIIPSLTTYLERHPKAVRFSILLGTSLPFITYIIWEVLILGIVPVEGVYGLLEAEAKGVTATDPLQFFFPHSPIYLIGRFFEAFALTTSFLGVTLGLLDFLSDGLQVAKVGFKKVGLCALIYVPPIIIAAIDPTIFFRALGYAGGIGCALLLGLFPVLMVWRGRYMKHYSHLHTQLPGGKVTLSFLAAFVVFELSIQFIKEVML